MNATSPNGRSHAVVLGASMAGLGAARALSNHFEHVTVVERDRLPDGPSSRKGVPQGNHAHGLLASGYRTLDAYFPDMMAQLEAEGVPSGDVTGGFLWYQYGHWKLRADSGLHGIGASRPFLEAHVCRRVRALPSVRFLEEHDVEEPVYDAAARRVVGVRVKDRNSGGVDTLDAALVVDTTGRGSQAPKWLESWGLGAVAETAVKIDVGYATTTFERKPGDLFASNGAIIAGTVPASGRLGAILPAENDRWIITLAGSLGDHPPTDIDGWKDFARGLPTTALIDMVHDREPLTEILSYRFPANRHRHFERIKPFPRGLIVMGDAMCSFNPIYGQGMSVSLLEARALDECLAAGDVDLAARFYKRAKKIVASPWMIATGEDLRFPQVEGKRPPGFKLLNRYMERAHHAATKDPVVLKRFFEVANLLAPPTTMMSPAIAWRVVLGGRGRQQDLPLPPEASETIETAIPEPDAKTVTPG